MGMEIVAAGIAHQARAGAVPAISGAVVGHQKQNAVWITMHQPGYRRVRVLPARIGHLPGSGVGFLDTGYVLAAYGAILVSGVDEVDKVRCYRERGCMIGVMGAGIFV